MEEEKHVQVRAAKKESVMCGIFLPTPIAMAAVMV